MRCNMDIKFIGSGPSAKAVMYYITDYITKSQLKAHVAYTALELSVKKLGDYNPEDDDFIIHAKKLLQKCAYSMISHQELSAQQVCSYLMNFEDHFTSHKYHNLYWISFENFINQEDPSPECSISEKDNHQTDDVPDDNLNDILDDVPDDVLDDIPEDDILQSEFSENIIHNPVTLEDDEEIGVHVDPSGILLAKAHQVADYQLRSDKLHDVCVWDFVSQIEKKTKSSILSNRKNKTDESDSMDISENEDFESYEDNEDQFFNVYSNLTDSDTTSINKFLNVSTRKQSIFHFKDTHLEFQSHMLSVCNRLSRFIPVPIGPSLPRNDREKMYPRYCRLMLILFKPWVHASDLRDKGQTWPDAFLQYNKICPDRFKSVMKNIQILHECCDSRYDHFSNRKLKQRSDINFHGLPPSHSKYANQDNQEDFGPEDDDGYFILQHLQSIEDSQSMHQLQGAHGVITCLYYASKDGMFTKGLIDNDNLIQSNMSINNLEEDDVVPNLEEIWQHTYDNRRNISKKAQPASLPSSTFVHDYENQHNNQQNIIQDGSQFQSSFTNAESQIYVPSIQNATQSANIINHTDELIVSLTDKYDLNTEQERAFHIIVKHSTQNKPDPLHMFLGGPGGTGKTRVINAVTEFFETCNQHYHFKLASYTGIAAKNISGTTLHAALNLNQFKKKGSKLKTLQELITRWDGVDYLFIDEVSMIGCHFLLQISQALTEAKQNTSPFGGINVIFAGDFSQLPPVGETRLFSHINTARVNTKKSQDEVLGKLLWLSVTTVVILSEIRRQSDPVFIALLNRLRYGKCNDADFNLLNTRILGNFTPDWSQSHWKNVTTIVSNNDVKDAINVKAAEAFAHKSNQELHWYYATDTHQGKHITDPLLKVHLEKLHSGKTNQRLGKIPLVLGMPVIITHNFDVQSGIVNGCTGTLTNIRYQVDINGNRHATSCVIHAPHTSGGPLPHLHDHHVVALQESTDMKFVHPYSHKKCTIKRTQIPILPAFSITAHKAQGQTLTHAIIDIHSC